MRVENTFLGAEGVGEATERSIWEAGVTHWDEFEPSLVGATRAERIESFLAVARDRLAASDAGFFARALPDQARWRLYENFRESACFFDIETTGLDHDRHEVTTVSFHRDGETRTLVQGDDLTAEAVTAELEAAPLLITYNGGRFDIPFLEASLGLDIGTPHLDAMRVCHALDLTGGLAGAEQALGIDRDRPDISGEDAVRLWREHERGRDGALETLISYNQADTVNLKTVMDRAVARLDQRVFPGGH
ncbi:MAG: ribonuclease H-like domain-containing protein [Halobacteriaceae archaeon]